jgi:hypothetical protein
LKRRQLNSINEESSRSIQKGKRKMLKTGVHKARLKERILTVLLLAFISVFPIFSAQAMENQAVMKIRVEANGQSTVYQLNNSTAAKELHAQLPMSIEVEDYGGLEKIFYPPQKLNTTDTPLVNIAKNGTLAYYAPWGDVVMFYDKFGSASGLYELGDAISGAEHIRSMSGSLRITQEK